MRLVRPIVLLVLLIAAPAARADGLTRFQELLAAKGRTDMIRFTSGSSLGIGGFTLENVVVTPPPDMVDLGKMPVKPMPTRIERIVVEDVDFDSIAKDKPPLFLRARFEGVVLDGRAAPDGAMLKFLGTDSALLDVSVDYRFDAAKEAFALNRFEVELRGFARVELAVSIEGVTSDVTDDPKENAGGTTLRSASLMITDDGLMARLMRAFATDRGASPDQLAETAAQTVIAAMGEGAVARGAAHTIAAFLRDWQGTKGPLRISLAPGSQITFDDLGAIDKAEDAMKELGLAVTYAGTTVEPPPLPPRITGRAAIERLVGNTTTATIDGSEIVDYYAADGTYVSQVDAVIAKGQWRINDEDQLCRKFPDEDENCFNIAVAGRKVTYIYDVDDEEQFELHDGNARNL